MSTFHILYEYRWAFIRGLLVTLELFAVASIAGTLFGVGIGIGLGRFPIMKKMWGFVSTCFSAIPALVLLFWIHYPLQAALGVVIDPFYSAVTALTAINAVAIAGMVKEALEFFPRHYLDAAKVCGMPRRAMRWRIQLPLLFRSIVPRWLDQQVVIFHCTIFASLISVEEFFRVSQRVNSVVYKPIAIYTIVALIFMLVAVPAILFARRLHRSFSRDYSER